MSKRMSEHALNERITAALSVIETRKSINTVAKEYKIASPTVKEMGTVESQWRSIAHLKNNIIRKESAV